MEINQALRLRIDEIKSLLKNKEKRVLEEKFGELFLLFNRVEKDFLNRDVVDDVHELKSKIVIDSVKAKLLKTEKKERKLKKIDDFNELCNLIKYQQFDEAIKKFNERRA